MGLAQGASAPQPSLKLPECSLRPDQLRSLVLDYCIHHGYANTTKELLKLDAQTSPHDLSHAQADTEMGGPEHIMPASASQILTDLHLRSRITQLILSGLVPDAIHLLQLHFPQTLHIPNSPQSSGKDGMPSQDRPNKKPKRQASSGVTSPGSPETSGYAEESTHGCGDDGWLPHIPALRRATALAPVDLDTNATRILGLDLRIQTFIEAIRSTNFSTLSGNSSSSSNSSTSSDADGQNIAQILSMGQSLFALTYSLDLPVPVIAAYQTELNHASELFLYSSTDEAPESSHVRPLLDFARRQDLARRVNVAILGSVAFFVVLDPLKKATDKARFLQRAKVDQASQRWRP